MMEKRVNLLGQLYLKEYPMFQKLGIKCLKVVGEHVLFFTHLKKITLPVQQPHPQLHFRALSHRAVRDLYTHPAKNTIQNQPSRSTPPSFPHPNSSTTKYNTHIFSTTNNYKNTEKNNINMYQNPTNKMQESYSPTKNPNPKPLTHKLHSIDTQQQTNTHEINNLTPPKGQNTTSARTPALPVLHRHHDPQAQ